MDFETEARDGDEVFESEGVKLYVDPMSIAYLDGTKIDYVQTFKFSGFHFENSKLVEELRLWQLLRCLARLAAKGTLGDRRAGASRRRPWRNLSP